MPRPSPRQLRSAQGLLKEFHGWREAQTLRQSPWRGPWELWAIGPARVLYYSSDKADPGDESDRGGEWKGYYHDQDDGTLVYLPPSMAAKVLGVGERPRRVLRPAWPDVLVWLGAADGYEVEVGGKVLEARLDGGPRMGGVQLWSFPDRSALVAAPASGGREEDCVLWTGPALTVTRAGIEG